MATNIPLTGLFNVTCEYKRKNSENLKWIAGFHTGIDLTGSDTIYGTCDGEVTKIGTDESYGNYITIKDSKTGKYHWFCHLSKVTCKEGDKITRVSKIGVMGSTGNVTGKHLHYEIRNSSNKYGDTSDPADYMRITNRVGTYNSKDYALESSTSDLNNDIIKVFGVATNIREEPNLKGKSHLYKAGTTVKILEENVIEADGYIWDKVEAIYANEDDFSIGYVARTENRYK